MSTIRNYFFGSLIFALKIGLIFLVCLLIFFVINWIVPISIYNGIVVQILGHVRLIFLVVVLFIVVSLLYELYRIGKTEKSLIKKLINMSPTILIWLFVVGFGLVYLNKLFDGVNCKSYNYNQNLNGGIKEFNGKKYMINICGSGVNNSHFFGDSMDTVQLSITDEQGQLLAKRRYKVFWEAQPGHEPLIIGKNSITYQDDGTQTKHTVAMPPTFLDWIRARLPFFN